VIKIRKKEKSLSKHTSWFQLINRPVSRSANITAGYKGLSAGESKGMDESNSGWLNDYSLYS